MEEDRSGLFSEISGFSQRKLKKVQTKVVTGTGEKLVEKRGAKGLQSTSADSASTTSNTSNGQVPARKVDLQVGLVVPGLMIASHDVAHNKKTLEEYGITHILNLASEEIENMFEEDFNYFSLDIEDSPKTNLKDYFDECFEFIEEGKFRGNCLVHCNATVPGLSRATSICVAFLMSKEKRKFNDAYNEVKEARSLTKPNDGFMKQLLAFDEELHGKKKTTDIEDPFTLKKRQEIEAEKAALKDGVKLKDRLKVFGSGTNNSDQERSASPAAPTTGILKNKWTPPTGLIDDTMYKRDDGPRRPSFVPDYKNEDGSPAPKVKLTSIISLFNKPKEGGEGVAPRPLFPVNKNAAPVKKWATVEPPPPPGFCRNVKRNKSRRWLNNSDSVRRNKSRGNFQDAVKRTKSREFRQNRQASTDVSEKKTQEKVAEETVSTPVETENKKRGSFRRRRGSRQESVEVSDVSQAPTVTPTSCPPPPPPPPPPMPNAEPSSPKVPQSPDSEKTPWRRRRSSREKAEADAPPRRRRSLRSQASQEEAAAAVIPVATEDTPRFRTSISVTSTRSPSCTSEHEDSSDSAATKSAPPPPPPPPPAPPLPPLGPPKKSALANRSSKPETTKVIGTGISVTGDNATEEPNNVIAASKKATEIVPPPPPPPPPAPIEPTKNEKARKDEFLKKKSVSIVASSSESEEEVEAVDERYSNTPLEDRRSSDIKGLNRSSTMEILKLIKSKTGANLVENSELDTVDEDDEIETLLAGLEDEGIDNIDWGELGIDVHVVKDIVETHKDDTESEEETETEESEEDEDEETVEEESEEEEDVPLVLSKPPARNNATFVVAPKKKVESSEEEESD